MQAALRWLATLAIGIFWDKILVFAKSLVEVWATRREIKARAEESVRKLREAKSGKEVSESTKSALDDL